MLDKEMISTGDNYPVTPASESRNFARVAIFFVVITVIVIVIGYCKGLNKAEVEQTEAFPNLKQITAKDGLPIYIIK